MAVVKMNLVFLLAIYTMNPTLSLLLQKNQVNFTTEVTSFTSKLNEHDMVAINAPSSQLTVYVLIGTKGKIKRKISHNNLTLRIPKVLVKDSPISKPFLVARKFQSNYLS